MKRVNLKGEVSIQSTDNLKNEIEIYCSRYKKVICKGLNRRPVFIEEYPLFLKKRYDKKHRMKCFFTSIELIKIVQRTDITSTQSIGGGLYSYEFKGITKKGRNIGVHIKEFYIGKNKILKLISTFWT